MRQDLRQNQAEYAELLRKPQWQKRRLQMLEKAGWKCIECGATELQLHVHHKRYISSAKPWEYEDEDLAVLCERCHELAHGRESSAQPCKSWQRRKPSAVRTMLRLVMLRPEWAARLTANIVPADSSDGCALIAIIDMISLSEPIPVGGLGALIERFRDTPHADTLARVAGEMADEEIDDSIIEPLFELIEQKLQAHDVAAKIGVLLQKDRDGALHTEDREQLASLLLKKRELSKPVDGDLAQPKSNESSLPPWESASNG